MWRDVDTLRDAYDALGARAACDAPIIGVIIRTPELFTIFLSLSLSIYIYIDLCMYMIGLRCVAKGLPMVMYSMLLGSYLLLPSA